MWLMSNESAPGELLVSCTCFKGSLVLVSEDRGTNDKSISMPSLAPLKSSKGGGGLNTSLRLWIGESPIQRL